MADKVISVRVVVQQNVVRVQKVTALKGDKGDPGTGLQVVTLTQIEYDALSVPEQTDPTIWYNITS